MRRTLSATLAIILFCSRLVLGASLAYSPGVVVPRQVPALGAMQPVALSALWRPTSSLGIALPASRFTGLAAQVESSILLAQQSPWGAISAVVPPTAGDSSQTVGAEESSIQPALERFEREFRDAARAQGVEDRRLPYILSKDGVKTKRVFVLVHGMGESPEGMAQLARFYRDHGHNVLALLLSGHGRDNEALEAATAEQWEQDLDQAIAFARQLGQEVVLVGFSLGGVLALRAAQRHQLPAMLLSPGLKLADSVAGYMDARLAQGETWWSDHPVRNNPYSNSRLPMSAYIQYRGMSGQVQRDFQEAQLSGLRMSQPVAVLASEADNYLDMDFLRRFAAFQGGEISIYDQALGLGHTDVIRPAGGFTPEFEALYQRWMARLR